MFTLGMCQRQLQPVLQQQAVGQPGEGVVVGQKVGAPLQFGVGVGQLVLHRLALADVVADPDRDFFFTGLRQRARQVPKPHQGAIAAAVAPFDVDALAGGQAGSDGQPEMLVVVGGAEKNLGAVAEQFTRGIAQQVLEARVAVLDQAVAGKQNADAGVFQYGLLLQQQAAQLRFRALALPDVLKDPDRAVGAVGWVDGFGAQVAMHGAAIALAHQALLLEQLPSAQQMRGLLPHVGVIGFGKIQHRGRLADQFTLRPAKKLGRARVAMLHHAPACEQDADPGIL